MQILQPNNPDESIYKWKFNDTDDQQQHVMRSGHFPMSNSSQISQPVSNCHRVEYLPCDGICAEETILDSTHNNPDSARSNSSARTSRGCNTEETRIFPETKLHQQLQTPYELRGLLLGKNEPYRAEEANVPPQQFQTTNGGFYNGNGVPMTRSNRQQENTNTNRMKERNFYPFHGEDRGGGGGDVIDQMKSMSIRNERHRNDNKSGRAAGLKSGGSGGGGDVPHALGTVPK
jgi:hypothetical protein